MNGILLLVISSMPIRGKGVLRLNRWFWFCWRKQRSLVTNAAPAGKPQNPVGAFGRFWSCDDCKPPFWSIIGIAW